MPQYWDLSTADNRKHFDEFVTQMILAGKKPVVKFEAPESTRSDAQGNAMWLWCEMVAKYLNDCGLDMKAVLRHDAEIPWTKSSVAEYMWRPVQKAMTGEDSTKKPSKTQWGDISQVITMHISTTQGVTLPAWPERHGEG